MKLFMLALVMAACLGMIVSTAFAAGSSTSDSNVLALRVMTFNLRYASSTPPNSWPERRPVMKDTIRRVAPDLIGTQEGLAHQLSELADDLSEYRWIGIGRDDGHNRGEFMAIFYRADRFEPRSTNYFWLSDTPEIPGSATWGNTSRRMVTWVKFRDRRSGREFYLWDTHLDNAVAVARAKGATLIRERIGPVHDDLPLILTGDFNAAAADSRPYSILVTEGELLDTWFLAKERVNEKYNSFQGFQKPKQDSVRIDWILVRGKPEVDRTEIVTDSEHGQFPSDHFPVVVDLKF